ncbi:hypothetical protein PTKIN_Ptkin03bG0125800 [Pterospermum kingtungense]
MEEDEQRWNIDLIEEMFDTAYFVARAVLGKDVSDKGNRREAWRLVLSEILEWFESIGHSDGFRDCIMKSCADHKVLELLFYALCAIVAAVARNEEGDVLYSSTKKFSNVELVLHVEILAIRFGTELALFNNIWDVIIKSDSSMAIREISKGDESLCPMGVWL